MPARCRAACAGVFLWPRPWSITPPVLVLDEPTAGVDVELRQQLWRYVRELNAGGVTVLLTTHYLEEAEQLCDRIAIINHGRLIACDTTAALLRRLDAKELTIIVDRDLTAVPASLGAFDTVLKDPRRLAVRYQPSRARVAQILAAVQAAGLEIVDLSTLEADLEDIFLQLTRGDRAQEAERRSGKKLTRSAAHPMHRHSVSALCCLLPARPSSNLSVPS